jgi:hypothetical protein
MNLNPFKPMNRKSIAVFLLLQLMVFAIAYSVSVTVFKDIYLPGWTAHNRYLYVWVLVIVLTVLKKPIISAALTLGNVLGLLIGQTLGDFLRNMQMQKITADMEPGDVAMLSQHNGWFIWICTILVFLTAGIVITVRANGINNADEQKKQRRLKSMFLVVLTTTIAISCVSIIGIILVISNNSDYTLLSLSPVILPLIALPTVLIFLTISIQANSKLQRRVAGLEQTQKNT